MYFLYFYCINPGVIKFEFMRDGILATHCAPLPSLHVGGVLYNQLANDP